jgi:hypothetical protein
LREMVFHHPSGDFRTGHVQPHTNGTVFSVTQLIFLLSFTLIQIHMFIFIFIFFLFFFFFLRSPTVLATTPSDKFNSNLLVRFKGYCIKEAYLNRQTCARINLSLGMF